MCSFGSRAEHIEYDADIEVYGNDDDDDDSNFWCLFSAEVLSLKKGIQFRMHK